MLPTMADRIGGAPQVPVAYRGGVDFVVKSETPG